MNYVYNFLLLILLFTANMINAQEPENCDNSNCLVDEIIINTGFDNKNERIIGIGDGDIDWKLVQSPDENATVPAPAWVKGKNYGWANPMQNTQWISANEYDNYNSINPKPNKPYVFEYCFCVCEETDLNLNMEFLADNYAEIIFDNDTLYRSYYNNSIINYFLPFKIIESLFVNPGKHCLQINLYNNYNRSSMGFNVQGKIRAQESGILMSEECCESSGTIMGRVLNDRGSDYEIERDITSENGLTGWEVTLEPIGKSTTTDSNGYYYFNDLAPGNYSIKPESNADWFFTYPSGQYLNVELNDREIIRRDLAYTAENPDPCYEILEESVEELCCKFNFLLEGRIQKIDSISYNITGGILESATDFPCNYSKVKSTPLGMSSGKIIYPSCDALQNINFAISPSTATGDVKLEFTVYNGHVACSYVREFKCDRAPIEKYDELKVQPFPYDNFQFSGRSFKIKNNKIPASPICSLKIETQPQPSSETTGGGLYVDGNNELWNTPYNIIDLSSDPANNSVQFNLGVDYTLGWTGDVNITVYHCDGDSSELTYKNWEAKRPDRPMGDIPWVEANPEMDSLFAIPIELNISEIKKEIEAVEYITISSLGGHRVLAVTTNNIGLNEPDDERNFVLNSEIAGEGSAVFQFNKTWAKEYDKATPKLYILAKADKDEEIDMRFEWTLYDENIKAIASDTITKIFPVGIFDKRVIDIGQEGVKILKSVPNPAKDKSTIYYMLGSSSKIELSLFDLQGNKLRTIFEGSQESGLHKIELQTTNLAQGTYYIKLVSEGSMDIYKLIVIH